MEEDSDEEGDTVRTTSPPVAPPPPPPPPSEAPQPPPLPPAPDQVVIKKDYDPKGVYNGIRYLAWDILVWFLMSQGESVLFSYMNWWTTPIVELDIPVFNEIELAVWITTDSNYFSFAADPLEQHHFYDIPQGWLIEHHTNLSI